MVDDALDFILFILLMGVCISVTFNFVIPVVKQSNEDARKVIIDKTAPKFEMDIEETTFDGMYNHIETALILANQDTSLPEPKKIYVNSDYLHITNSYLVNRITYGMMFATSLDRTKRYEIRYDYGTTGSTSDDFYKVTPK